MLFIKESNEPLWGKYVADTISVGGHFAKIDPELDEEQIDEWVWGQMSEEAKETLYKAPANGRYRKCTK